MLEYNLGNATGEVGGGKAERPRVPLAAVYPREGMLFADQPYVMLSAPWVSRERRAAARVLLDFLRSGRAQERFLRAGFRLPNGRVGDVINVKNGLLSAPPADPLVSPSREVFEAVQASWPAVRKRARALIVIDTSAAAGPPMREADPSPLPFVVPALRNVLKRFADDEEVGLWVYSPKTGANPPHVELAPLTRLAENRALLDARIRSLRPAGPAASPPP